MKTITKNELLARLGSGGTVVVNVLRKEGYDAIHIRGSISIPRKDLEEGAWQRLDKGKEIVVHCSNYACGASRMAAEFLEAKGFDTKAYEGGIKEWAESGLPTEGSMTASEYLAQLPHS